MIRPRDVADPSGFIGKMQQPFLAVAGFRASHPVKNHKGTWLDIDKLPRNKLGLFRQAYRSMLVACCCICRDIDKLVARTKERPLTSGKITPKEALGVFAGLAFAAFLLVLQLNTNTILLSIVALLLAATYPFMKRYHYFPQVHLGAAFAWAIPMAYTAITQDSPPQEAWLLFVAALLWTTAYDTQYGMVDREDDLKIGVKSTAILFGKQDNAINGTLQLLTLILLTCVGLLNNRGVIFYGSILMASGFVIYQQFLTETREPAKCLQAFLNNNWFGMVIFLGIALDFLRLK